MRRILPSLFIAVAFALRGGASAEIPHLTPQTLALLDANNDGQVTLEEAQAVFPIVTQAIFDAVDANHDGVLTLADLPGTAEVNAEEALRRLLHEADTNGDGLVSYAEAVAAYPIVTPALYDKLDTNNDGVLSADDLPEEPQPANPFEVLKQLILSADANHDGCVTYVEALAILPQLPEELFAYMDRNGDGCLNGADLPPSGTLSGAECIEMLLRLLHLADADGDGAVTYEEAVALVPALPQSVFDYLDANGDGALSEEDLPATADGAGPIELLLQLLDKADANDDGAISYEEALTIVPTLARELFDYLDRNDDGVLDECDLPAELPEGGWVELFLRLFHQADANDDGEITWEEATALMPALPEQVFDCLDRSGDGVLSSADLPASVPADNLVKWLLKFLDEADTNGDGAVSYDEAVAVAPELPQALFDTLDRNGDGVLSAADLPEAPCGTVLDQLLDLLKEADANSDGALTLEEIQAVDPDFSETLFNTLDRNEDGVLSLADLPSEATAAEAIVRLFKLADANNDGEVTLAEIQALVPGLTQEQFDALDRNDDGVLSSADLPEASPEDVISRLLRLLAQADVDDNGEVTLAEIQAIVPAFTQEAFDALDRNGDGVLSRADLPSAEPPADLREKLLALLREADADGNGEVTFEELQAVCPEATQEQFDKLDRNGDGVLSRDDLPAFATSPAEHLLSILREADADGNGEVTFEELQVVVPELTQEQFDKLDRNGDGVISAEDAASLPEDPLKRLICLLSEADADGNGEVTFEELQAVAPELTQEQFDRLDRNGDGVISRADLPSPPEDPRERLIALLRQADVDDNGEVTFEELQAVVPELTQEKFDFLDTNDDGVLSAADLPDSVLPAEDDQRVLFLQAFVKADLNGDGALDYEEIALAFPDAPAALLAAIDTNNDWSITRQELMDALAKALDGLTLILKADLDASGSADAVDVQVVINHALNLLGSILMADIDGNGRVDAMDIQTVINSVLSI